MDTSAESRGNLYTSTAWGSFRPQRVIENRMKILSDNKLWERKNRKHIDTLALSCIQQISQPLETINLCFHLNRARVILLADQLGSNGDEESDKSR